MLVLLKDTVDASLFSCSSANWPQSSSDITVTNNLQEIKSNNFHTGNEAIVKKINILWFELSKKQTRNKFTDRAFSGKWSGAGPKTGWAGAGAKRERSGSGTWKNTVERERSGAGAEAGAGAGDRVKWTGTERWAGWIFSESAAHNPLKPNNNWLLT